jgi:hypothetical protein
MTKTRQFPPQLKIVGHALLGVSIASAVLMFVFWALAIWNDPESQYGDQVGRFGETALLFLALAFVTGITRWVMWMYEGNRW